MWRGRVWRNILGGGEELKFRKVRRRVGNFSLIGPFEQEIEHGRLKLGAANFRYRDRRRRRSLKISF